MTPVQRRRLKDSVAAVVHHLQRSVIVSGERLQHFLGFVRRPEDADGGIHLSGASVHHGGGKDGHDGGVWVEDALLQHGGVLLHPPVQRHVVILGPAAQRVEQQDWAAVAALDQTLVGVLHQESVTIVDWVPELERKHCV